MADETISPEPITVDFRKYRKRTFKTIEQIVSWAEKEKEIWTEFQKETDPTKPHNQQNPAHQISQKSLHILSLAKQFVQNTDSAFLQNKWDEIKTQIIQYSKQRNYLSSESVLGKQICELAKSKPVAAFIWLEQETTSQVQTGHIQRISEYIQGHIDVEIAKRNPKALTASNIKSLESAKAKWEDMRDAQENGYHKSLATFNSHWENDIVANNLYRRKLFRRALKALDAFDKSYESHQEKMGSIEQAFTTDMELSASENYWTTKSTTNRKRAHFSLVLFALVGGLGIWGLTQIYPLLSASIPETWNNNLPLSIFAYGTPALIVVWVLQITARRYRTNEAMADDAEERIAMVKTFKALEFEKNAATEERIVALQALFRPHDRPPEDSLPSPVWDALLKRLNK